MIKIPIFLPLISITMVLLTSEAPEGKGVYAAAVFG